MPSRIGRSATSTRGFNAASTPSGTPINTQMKTATAISEIVTMLSDQTPTTPG